MHLLITEKQRLKFEAINTVNYETARAWRIKENFRDIHFNQPKEDAFILFCRWRQDAKNSKINAIIKVAEMFDRHMNGIVNAMALNKSNAMAERLNGKIQEIKLSAKGYRTFENYLYYSYNIFNYCNSKVFKVIPIRLYNYTEGVVGSQSR